MPSWDRNFVCSHLASLAVGVADRLFLRESPVAESNTVYPETNLLAAHVLTHSCGLERLSRRILDSISRFGWFYSPYWFLVDSRRPPPIAWARLEPKIVERIGGLVVKTMYPVGVLADWEQYSDRLLALAAWLALVGRRGEATELIRRAMVFFDGRGFRDKSWDGLYDTYKLALCIVAGETAEAPGVVKQCASALLSVAPPASKYDAELRGRGDLNVETASLAAIALHRLYRDQPAPHDDGGTARVAVLVSSWLLLGLALQRW